MISDDHAYTAGRIYDLAFAFGASVFFSFVIGKLIIGALHMVAMVQLGMV